MVAKLTRPEIAAPIGTAGWSNMSSLAVPNKLSGGSSLPPLARWGLVDEKRAPLLNDQFGYLLYIIQIGLCSPRTFEGAIA